MLHNNTILIVDDQEINRTATSLVLKSLGYKVQAAKSAEAALNLTAREQYAVILMDCDMPGMSGIECTKKIRSSETDLKRRMPVIAFSSSDKTGIRQSCLDAGMDVFLSKDCSNEKLDEAIAALLKAQIGLI